MFTFISNSPQETQDFAFRLAGQLRPGACVAFFGGLGAGKTTFTRGLAKGLGVTDDVSSPTFSILNEYHGQITLYHFDMYRIETWDDLYSVGFFDCLDQKAVVVVEWSENIENALPENTIKVTITAGETEQKRVITVEGYGEYENFSC